MKRTIVSSLAVVALTLAAWGSPASSQEIQERTIRWGHLLAPDHPQGHAIRRFAEVVAQKSGGKMKVREFPSSQLGNELQQQSALQSGTQEMMSGGTTTLVGMIPEFGVLDFPFVFSTYEEAAAMLDGPVGRMLMDKLPARGFIGLAYLENGFRNVTNSRRPIQSAGDLTGLKIRVQQNPIYIDVFKALNAVPVPLAFGELYSALETKTVDAQENPLSIILSNKFYEVQKYLTITNHNYGTNIALVSKRFWDKLSATERRILEEAAVEARDLQRRLVREGARQAVADLRAKGTQVNEISQAEVDKMRKTTRPIVDGYASKYDPVLTKAFFSELERIHRR